MHQSQKQIRNLKWIFVTFRTLLICIRAQSLSEPKYTHNISPIQSFLQAKFPLFSYNSAIEMAIKIRNFSSCYLKNVSICLQIQEPPMKALQLPSFTHCYAIY